MHISRVVGEQTHYQTFIIEKYLTAAVQESMKTIRNNTFTVKVKNKKYAELLLRTTALHNMKIKAYPHKSLNTSKGVVRSLELDNCTIDENKKKLKKQFITDVKRITIKKNSQELNTNTYILIQLPQTSNKN